MLAYEYVFPFLLSFGISCVLSITLFRLSFQRQWLWRSRDAAEKVPRFGGIVLFFGFWGAILADPNLRLTSDLFGLVVGSVFIFFIGFLDDIKKLHWSFQLSAQVLTAVGIYALGVRVASITNPFGGVFLFDSEHFFSMSLLIGIVWFIVLFNSINWLDGMDGLAGGVLCIAAAVLFVVSLRPEVYQPPTAILALALLGSCFGFLSANMYPAKIVLGTSGAFLGAFFLGYISIFAGAKMATTLSVLTLPVLDAAWVIAQRIRSGKSIFQADFYHLHYRLRSLKWSYHKILLFFYILSGGAAIIAVCFGAQWKLGLFFFGTVLFIVFSKYTLH